MELLNGLNEYFVGDGSESKPLVAISANTTNKTEFLMSIVKLAELKGEGSWGFYYWLGGRKFIEITVVKDESKNLVAKKANGAGIELLQALLAYRAQLSLVARQKVDTSLTGLTK